MTVTRPVGNADTESDAVSDAKDEADAEPEDWYLDLNVCIKAQWMLHV